MTRNGWSPRSVGFPFGCVAAILLSSCYFGHEEFDLVADLRGDAGGCQATLAGQVLAPRGDSTLAWHNQAFRIEMFGVSDLEFACSFSGHQFDRPESVWYMLSIGLPIDSTGAALARSYRLAAVPDPSFGLEVATLGVIDTRFTDSVAQAVHNVGGLFLTVVSGTLDVTEVQKGGLVGHLVAKVRLKQSIE